jgi:hypothetical protein
MMKLIPIKACSKRLGLSYSQIECDSILKVVQKNGQDFVLSASITCYRRNQMQQIKAVRCVDSRACPITAIGSVGGIRHVVGFGVVEWSNIYERTLQEV